MASIQVQEVTKVYGLKKLFIDVTVNFSSGRRYGITGPNGAGKSTFLKILSGELEPDTGTVWCPKRPSVLKQNKFGFASWRVLVLVILGPARLWTTLAEKAQLLAHPELTEAEGTLLGELEAIIA